MQGIVKCFLFHLCLFCKKFQVADSLTGDYHSKLCTFFQFFFLDLKEMMVVFHLVVVCNNLLHILTFLFDLN